MLVILELKCRNMEYCHLKFENTFNKWDVKVENIGSLKILDLQ